MQRTKKTVEKKEEVVVQASPFTVDSSYVSISGETKTFKARKFVPISEISLVCDSVASAIANEIGYSPYLEEFLVWTAIVRLYTDLEIDELLEQEPDVWYEELTCSNLRDVIKGIILAGQYDLIVDSVAKMIDYAINNRKSSFDILIDALAGEGDGLLFELLEKVMPHETESTEGAEPNGQLS